MQKLVLIVQPIRLQGLIWQAVLKSQNIAVIWESPHTDLADNLDQLKMAGLALPDLLILDMQTSTLNPYAFCRWCREQYPGTKVVLTNSKQMEISLSERQWAVNQGASDLLPGFRRDNLVTGVTNAVKRILEILDDTPLNNGALIAVILSMKRQLTAKTASPAPAEVTPPAGEALRPAFAATASSLDSTAVSPSTAHTNGKALSNGRSLSNGALNGSRPHGNGSQTATVTSTPLTSTDLMPLSTSKAIMPVSSTDDTVIEPDPLTDAEASNSDSGSRPARRYRGMYY